MIEEIRRRLREYQPEELPGEGRPKAAVLVPLYEKDGQLHVVLTKRTDRVETHKGEICFPGGAFEAHDPDLAATALRESEEEIGLEPGHVRVIGRLDDIVTVSSFHVSPYVGEIDAGTSPYRWRPQSTEVAEILEVPLPHLLDNANLVEVPRLREGQVTLMEGFAFGEHVVWGATARMLRNFLDVALKGIDITARA
jgi:8-oxo-dGTP pyrophosphatase MutT (NUDIX family)